MSETRSIDRISVTLTDSEGGEFVVNVDLIGQAGQDPDSVERMAGNAARSAYFTLLGDRDRG